MFNAFSKPRRVVITGFGCVTPIGSGKDGFWDGLREGRSGVGRISLFETEGSAVTIAAEIPDFDPNTQLPPKEVKHVGRHATLALAAARGAIRDSGLEIDSLPKETKQRFGVIVGTGGGGLSFTERQYAYWYGGEGSKASVYTIPSSTHGGLSSEISMIYGLNGQSHVISTGCTSSTDAIGYAAQQIALGKQDLILAGGSDSPLARGILEGFNMMTVLTKEWNDEPERASRPFSKDRSGIVLGEGAWIYLLESLDDAKARRATIYGEILGYGATCDAYHRVRLEEDGIEPARAMSLAIEDAGISANDIDYVNTHGTSTQLNDRIETRAIKTALGDNAYKIATAATKSQIGHPQGASGAAGVGAALMALQEGTIAATINLDIPDPECDLDYTPNTPTKRDVTVALCNCIGFGSKNSALVIKK